MATSVCLRYVALKLCLNDDWAGNLYDRYIGFARSCAMKQMATLRQSVWIGTQTHASLVDFIL